MSKLIEVSISATPIGKREAMKVDVPAYQAGEFFAVHPTLNGSQWTATHIGTGMALATGADKELCFELAKIAVDTCSDVHLLSSNDLDIVRGCINKDAVRERRGY